MNKHFYLTTLFLSSSVLVHAEEVDKSDWKDPIDRNQTIEHTTVSVTANKIEGGLFEYIYRIEGGTENKGKVSSFSLDISCDIDFGEVDLPPENPRILESNVSEDGLHVPAVVFGARRVANAIGITTLNKALWAVSVGPGEITEGFRIVSPAPPGLRAYKMEPIISTWGWRYDLYEPGDPRIKWLDDYRVTGEVIGPACKQNDDPEIAFLGAAEEPFGVNKFLAYAEPIRENVDTDATGAFQLIIFYDGDIDEHSFKAKLNGQDVSTLFSPIPGTFETVVVNGPWKKNNNKLHLSVLGKTGQKDKGNNEFKSIDNDVFEINIK